MASQPRTRNPLLAGLSDGDFAELANDLQPVALQIPHGLRCRGAEGLLNLSAQKGRLQPAALVEQRTACWLLMACDRVGSDVLPLPQEFLAAILGVRRRG